MSGQATIRVLIADDEPALRHALGELVEAEPELELVGSAADAAEAAALARETRPDVAVLDVRMPGGGLEATRLIAEGSPETAVLALSAYEDRATVIAILQAGAVGYLVKGVPPEEIVDAIRRASRGQASLAAALTAEVLQELARDNEERRQAEEVLRRSEQRFRGLLESAPDAVVIAREDGTIVLVNRRTEELFGYKREELLGGKIEQLVPTRFHERHVGHRTDYFRDPHPRRLGAGLDLAGRRKDGSEFPIDISLSALETDEGVLATAFVRDMTDQAQHGSAGRTSRPRFAALLEAASDAIVVLDPASSIVYANRQTEVLFEYDTGELVGRNMESLIPDRFGDHTPDPWTWPASPELQLTGRRKDGSDFPVELWPCAFDTEEGRRMAVFLRAATARLASADLQQHLAERRRLVARVVRASEEERARIAADIHDDTVQAMTAVGLRLGLLRRRLGDTKHLDALDELEENVRSSISRLRSLIFELRPPELDREGLASAVRTRLEQLRDEHGLEFELEAELHREPEPETRTIAFRIVQEALTNTRKHAEASRVQIVFDTRGVGLFGSVRDDGTGFSMEQLADRRRLGHLGVVAMRERAEVAGGWLRIESAPGTGTHVEFWVPDTPVPVDESARSDEAAA
jgi:PAS domain S-box-containing protein